MRAIFLPPTEWLVRFPALLILSVISTSWGTVLALAFIVNCFRPKTQLSKCSCQIMLLDYRLMMHAESHLHTSHDLWPVLTFTYRNIASLYISCFTDNKIIRWGLFVFTMGAYCISQGLILIKTHSCFHCADMKYILVRAYLNLFVNALLFRSKIAAYNLHQPPSHLRKKSLCICRMH